MVGAWQWGMAAGDRCWDAAGKLWRRSRQSGTVQADVWLSHQAGQDRGGGIGGPRTRSFRPGATVAEGRQGRGGDGQAARAHEGCSVSHPDSLAPLPVLRRGPRGHTAARQELRYRGGGARQRGT